MWSRQGQGEEHGTGGGRRLPVGVCGTLRRLGRRRLGRRGAGVRGGRVEAEAVVALAVVAEVGVRRVVAVQDKLAARPPPPPPPRIPPPTHTHTGAY